MMIVLEVANMSLMPWQTEILQSGSAPEAVLSISRTLSCKCLPYMPECM